MKIPTLEVSTDISDYVKQGKRQI